MKCTVVAKDRQFFEGSVDDIVVGDAIFHTTLEWVHRDKDTEGRGLANSATTATYASRAVT